jgi:hypothetical protein
LEGANEVTHRACVLSRTAGPYKSRFDPAIINYGGGHGFLRFLELDAISGFKIKNLLARERRTLATFEAQELLMLQSAGAAAELLAR